MQTKKPNENAKAKIDAVDPQYTVPGLNIALWHIKIAAEIAKNGFRGR